MPRPQLGPDGLLVRGVCRALPSTTRMAHWVRPQRHALLKALRGALAVAGLCAAAAALAQSPAPSTSPSPSQSPAAPAAQATDFDGATALLGKADFAGARDGFARYLDNNPTGPLTADAFFRKGFAHYGLREYQAALAAFAKAQETAPARYAAKAMLSMAMVHEETRNEPAARRLYDAVVDQYPNTEEATAALQRLGLSPPVRGNPINNQAANVPPTTNNRYAARISEAIRKNIAHNTPPGTNPEAEVTIHVASDGLITRRTLTKPSTSPEWNYAVLRAIDTTQRLPHDQDGRIPPTMVLVFRAR